MKTKKRVGIALLFLITLSACSSTQVMTDYKRKADFSSKRSYKIEHQPEINGVSAANINSLNKERIETALQLQLEQRGLNTAESPDVIVAYSLSSRVEKSYYSTYHTPYYGGRWGYYGGGMNSSTTTESATTYGDLTIALIDAKTNELIWYSVVSKPLDSNIKNREAEINKVIEKVFVEFPIKAVVG